MYNISSKSNLPLSPPSYKSITTHFLHFPILFPFTRSQLRAKVIWNYSSRLLLILLQTYLLCFVLLPFLHILPHLSHLRCLKFQNLNALRWISDNYNFLCREYGIVNVLFFCFLKHVIYIFNQHCILMHYNFLNTIQFP